MLGCAHGAVPSHSEWPSAGCGSCGREEALPSGLDVSLPVCEALIVGTWLFPRGSAAGGQAFLFL